MSESSPVPVRVLSLYGFATRVPLVQLVLGEQLRAMSPKEAREIAALLVECAESAEQDAFLFEFFATHIAGGSEKLGAGMLANFRKWRDEQDRPRPKGSHRG